MRVVDATLVDFERAKPKRFKLRRGGEDDDSNFDDDDDGGDEDRMATLKVVFADKGGPLPDAGDEVMRCEVPAGRTLIVLVEFDSPVAGVYACTGEHRSPIPLTLSCLRRSPPVFSAQMLEGRRQFAEMMLQCGCTGLLQARLVEAELNHHSSSPPKPSFEPEPTFKPEPEPEPVFL